MTPEKQQQIAFDDFTLDPTDASLWKGSKRIYLRPKTFALLQCLVAHPGQLVTKNQLLSVLWPGCHVAGEAPKHCVAEIRKALKDQDGKPRLIETAHGRGYRFIGTIIQQRIASPLNWNGLGPHNGELNSSGSQLVGRIAELSQLRQHLEKAMSGIPQVVFITGEQGIGKTTLVDAFLDLINIQRHGRDQDQPSKIMIARGQCIKSHGPGEAYMPFCEAMTSLCSKSDQGPAISVLRRYAPLWLLQMPSLVSAAQLRSLRNRTIGATRERMLREMTEALEVLTEEAPLILVLEDLHWSDYSSLDLIFYLAQRHRARLLLIATYRPAEVLSLQDHPLRTAKQELEARQQCRELPLGFLDAAAVDAYLKQRFPGHDFPANMAIWLQQRTAGNPLFLVNVLDHMVSRGLIVRRNRWTLSIFLENAELTLPPTIHHVIQHQFEMCTPQERQLLQAGSVVGMEFSVAEVAAALGEKSDQIETPCRKLAERTQFLQYADISQIAGERQKSYRFIHTLYQNTIYQMLPEDLHARLHRRVAEFMERSNRTTGKSAARLAMHFDRGREYRRALQYYQQAAVNANSQYAGHEALGLTKQGLQLLEMVPNAPERREREMCLQIELGRALVSTQGFTSEEAYRAFSRARELFHESRKPRHSHEKMLLFSALSGLCDYHWARAECEIAREIAEQMLQIAETEPNSSLLNQAHASLGVIMIDIGEFTAALQHMEQSAGLWNRCHAELVRWHLGYPARALENLESKLLNCSEHHESEGYVSAYGAMAYLHLARREGEKARKWAQSAIALASHHELVQQWIAPMKAIHGCALVKLGQKKRGFEQARQALAAFQAFGPTNLKPPALMMFADASVDADRIEEGLAAVEEALELVHRTGIHSCDAEIYRIKAELLWKQIKKHEGCGQYQQVESCFEEAISVARQQKAKSFELRATISLAKLLQEQNRTSEAYKRLWKIYRLMTKGQDVPDIQQARGLLQKLS